MDSRCPGFHRLAGADRLALVEARLGLPAGGLAERLRPEADAAGPERRSEDVVGPLVLPFSIAPNFRVDGRDTFVPMATEEPSVVAAAAHGARMLRDGPGIVTTVPPPVMTGQVLLAGATAPDGPAEGRLAAALPGMAAAFARAHPALAAGGGGLRAVRWQPSEEGVVALLDVDVGRAMGANLVNDACERLAPALEAVLGGRAALRILTNWCDRRVARAVGSVPLAALDPDAARAAGLADGIAMASRFAAGDVARAVTHNKGTFNGIDAVLVAAGQDWRAVEAAGHAWAARDGRYRGLARWRRDGDRLEGELDLPLAVGTVGGAVDGRPSSLAALAVLGILDDRDAARLASVVIAAGLAQNLAALRALAGEGIRRGHHRLHARAVAAALGATADEVDAVAALVAARDEPPDRGAVAEALAQVRAGRRR
jgi:hydroxymethylglutaryl-CoA reductase